MPQWKNCVSDRKRRRTEILDLTDCIVLKARDGPTIFFDAGRLIGNGSFTYTFQRVLVGYCDEGLMSVSFVNRVNLETKLMLKLFKLIQIQDHAQNLSE
ncbi:MAG: hypothetical protein IPL46_34615 [Saprospiraceae bacterium]|nr:hypothetical protein [Saprospiraceae bacterium]